MKNKRHNLKMNDNNITLSEELKEIIMKKNNNKMTDRRSKIVQEILTSELTYLQNLETLMKYFLHPMHEMEYIPNLSKNVQMLYNVGGALIKELKKDSNNIAGAFNKLAPYFKLYSVYAYDYRRVIASIQESQERDSDLKTFVRNQESKVETKLASLLITPIQRIPRYKLLIKEVLQYTDDQHEEYNLLQASLVAIETAAVHIDSMLAETENNKQLLELQKCIKNCINLIEPGRRLIKSGSLMKVSRRKNGVYKRYFILLSDNLLYCQGDPENSLIVTGIMPLNKCRVEKIFTGGMFRITCLQVSLLLYSERNDSEEWIQSLKTSIEEYCERRSTLKRESSSRIPRVLKKRKHQQDISMRKVVYLKKAKIQEETSTALQTILNFFTKLVNYFKFK